MDQAEELRNVIQSVPDDLEVFNTQMVVKQLLGGK